jgi:RHS repeat-associated protein
MTAQLSENSHQGFEAAKRMLCLAAMQAKSNTASGMPVCLRQNGIGSRSSSKERDAETGLDYFGARYYSGAQGRFTSVDPITMLPERLVDSQQLNLYAYARNNPLRFIDPTGMVIDDAKCETNRKCREWKDKFLESEEGQLLWNNLHNNKYLTITIEWNTEDTA